MRSAHDAQHHLSLAIELCRLLSQAADVSAADYRAVAYHCEQTLRVAGLAQIPVRGVPGDVSIADLNERLQTTLARARHYLGGVADCAVDTAQIAAEGAWRRAQTEVRT